MKAMGRRQSNLHKLTGNLPGGDDIKTPGLKAAYLVKLASIDEVPKQKSEQTTAARY